MTVIFQVTVNGPPLPGVYSVSNQGTVSGSNFSDVLTDESAHPGSQRSDGDAD